MARSKAAWIIPLSCVRPPDFTLTTVRIVAPAPARPQNRPAMALPIPWPINSWLELCLVLVILSATTDVSSVSILPRPASVRPGTREALMTTIQSIPSSCTFVKKGMGSPAGMLPMVSAESRPVKSETTVTTTRATSVAGTFLVTFGTRMMSAIQARPSSSAGTLIPSAMVAGKLRIMSSVLAGDFLPIIG